MAQLTRIALATTLLFCAPAVTVAQRAIDEAHELLAKGDSLADSGRMTEALEAWRRGYMTVIPDFRGLPFLDDVRPAFMKRDELRRRILELLSEEYPPERFARDEAALRAFGLMSPEHGDLETLTRELLIEEIGGFYDPDRKQLYLIDDDDESTEPPSFLERLLGLGGAMDAQESKTVVVHEMEHALADQHFDLLSLQKSAEHDDDMALAISALVEGDATLSMVVETAGPEVLGAGSALSFTIMDLATRIFAPFASGDTFKSAPPYLRETLLFPYLKGVRFCHRLAARGGWGRIDRAYVDPPTSTEQILHPEKYLSPADRDEPVAIELPNSPPLGAEWSFGKRNTLGELGIRILLRADVGGRAARRAADGWDGDTYCVLKAQGREDALVWATTWDSPADAREFARALFDARGPTDAEFSDSAAWSDEASEATIHLAGRDVTFATGLPRGATDAVLAWVAGAERSEKRLVVRRAQPKVGFSAESSLRPWDDLLADDPARGLRGYRRESFPERGWTYSGGVLSCSGGGGDLVTRRTHGASFELSFEFAVAPKANSGVMYRVTERHGASWQSGPEYQVLDDVGHELAADDAHSCGALYDIRGPLPDKRIERVGEFNRGRIIVAYGMVQHWLNGERVVVHPIDDAVWAAAVKQSKFARYDGFGTERRGRIALQDHGGGVRYRSLRLRSLDLESN